MVVQMPEQDEVGFLLGDVTDLLLDDRGDIVIGPSGDIELVRGERAVVQNIVWRIRTELGDWRLEPECGTELWRLAGAPNSPETGEVLRNEVHRALTHDGFVPDPLLTVEVAPESEESIAVFILIEGLTQAVKFRYDVQRGAIDEWQFIPLTS